MYLYRKLNLAERQEILRDRKNKGLPLHSPPHQTLNAGSYLISASNYEHKSIIDTPKRRTDFENELLATFKTLKANIKAWVILPNHYHILIHSEETMDLSLGLKKLHGKTSFMWNVEDSQPGRRVWFNYCDRMIRGEKHYYATLNYIHHNPVKHHCVRSEEDWKWSSFHLYKTFFGTEWLNQKWIEYPVKNFGAGWDD